MSKNKKRKPRPQPPHWYWLDSDNCWQCKNRNGCGGCKFLKGVVYAQSRRRDKNERRRGSEDY